MNLNRRGASPPLRFFFGLMLLLGACGAAPSLFARGGETRTWTIDGVKREALVYGSDDRGGKVIPRPLVFVFHGHGGTMKNAAQTFHLHELWPEALVVYPQGLPTSGKLVDREGRQAGWQFAVGEQKDRDLKFFDAVLDTLKHEGRVDLARVYVTGHSNGGAFSLLLWLERGKQIAAYAPSSAVMRPPYTKLQAARVLFIAGEKDELVKYEWQRAMYDALWRRFECSPPQKNDKGLFIADSKSGAHLVAFVHTGGHTFPPEAPQLIVDFFQQP